jgi:transcriptional regulator with XRE-family HTH domain
MSSDPSARHELAAFLRSRRERLSPETVGLLANGRRRTPGLRREEVAQLSGVGLTWYTWLEQGRSVNPSTEVLDAVTRALQMDAHERAHVRTLAGIDTDVRADDEAGARAAPAPLAAIVDALEPLPAYVVSDRWDLVVWNAGVRDLFGDLPTDAPTNLMRLSFTDERVRLRMVDWEDEAARHVAQYRAAMAHHLDDPGWQALADELARTSPDFRRLWAANDVARPENRIKRFVSPGSTDEQAYVTTVLLVASSPSLRLVVYTPT